ncbi:contact-dependent growth inhibition system immunity protein [Streptomyces sp. CB00316]|uniref:contact-dependent growth inhibition system immunity protein n=1 Tax=Streptomyces sp. CB00316 TaxID=1703932 RepID=UPI001300EFFF
MADSAGRPPEEEHRGRRRPGTIVPDRRTGSGTRVFRRPRNYWGGWFSQDIVDEFPGHDAAVADHTGTTNPQMVARLVGELHELPALPLDDGGLRPGCRRTRHGGEPAGPFSHGAWFHSLAATLSGVRSG